MTRVTGDWLHDPATQAVFDALEAEGHAVYVVGGCVRNALLGVPVSDIDMSTNARPDVVTRLAEAAGLRVVPTGIAHGTVTVLAEKEPFEVTTFRKDVATDGRRAVVAFADCLEDDAHRRDFTINALYADRDGQVRDVVGGLQDIAQRRLRFIDDADARIREDYLRILRYFRFFAWYGSAQGGMDPDALDAIASNLDGLAQLSRERVTSELVKLLSAPAPCFAVAAMVRTGVLPALLGAGDITGLQLLIAVEQELGLVPEPMLRLAAIGAPDPAQGLRLSRAQEKILSMFRTEAGTAKGPAHLGYLYGAQRAVQIMALRAAMLEMPVSPDIENEAIRGASETFPITSADLSDRFSGADLGRALTSLQARWIASDFTLTKTDLLAKI